MTDLFSDDARRNPFPTYAQVRAVAPLYREPRANLWMVFDYDGVNRVLSDHETFSSRSTIASEWMIFVDPPRHAKLRGLIARAFTPRSVADLEPRIRAISAELLDPFMQTGEMDLARDYALALPMRVIAEMLGIPPEDRPRFVRWNDVMLRMSYVFPGGAAAATGVLAEFMATTEEMAHYLAALLDARRNAPKDDLLTRLLQAEVEGERLTPRDILGFFQLLLLAGSETTTNLINNAILCFIEHPDQLARLRAAPELLPSAIEEVLRYRSPLQWMFRRSARDVEMHGRTIPAHQTVIGVIGSANHDPKRFADPERFDIARDPNPHLAFGHGPHFCLGAPLARLESRIALSDLLGRMRTFRRATDGPWEPREGLHVHGPNRLPIRFKPA